MSKEKNCGGCGKLINNCQCSYDFIFDVPEFIKRRSNALYHHREQNIFLIKRILIFLNYVIDNLPMVYVTRSGCYVEEHVFAEHSRHDTSRIVGSLLVTEFNELLINLVTGSYNSSLRTMRSMIEWLVRTLAATSDRSMLTYLPNDKNCAVCFAGLIEMMEAKDFHKNLQEENNYSNDEMKTLKQLVTKNEAISEHVGYIARFLNTKIPIGVGVLPKKLNDTIKKKIKVKDHESKEIIIGSDAIYAIYHLLSMPIHNTLEKIYEMNPGGESNFLDLDKFDDTFKIILSASDLILSLYVILIDIDVFHEREHKIQWRKFVFETFRDSKFGKHVFFGCESLLKSKFWLTTPPTEFTYPRTTD